MARVTKAPYNELDGNMVALCKTLNSFRGLLTIGSCGGHSSPLSYQQPEGSWLVTFRVEHNEHGWHALEFLAWFVNNSLQRSGRQIELYPYSAPPYLNLPGETLFFAVAAEGPDPDEFARELREARRRCYIPPTL